MDGADFCREIRGDAVLASTPFLMLVSGAGGSERKLAIRAGADDVLAKPLSRASLISAVARYLSASRVCGLPRIDLAVPVTLTVADRDERGVVRNLSRGGLFVETGCRLSADEEVGLRFRLPGSSSLLAPSAFVVWCSEGGHRAAAGSLSQRPVRGVGLRFLQIDSPSVRTLEDFVYTQGGPL
jgi:uncharacterized protein (TIGR02266 family)